MQIICDIYLLEELPGSSRSIIQLAILDPSACFEVNRKCSGFLGLNLNRIKAVSAVIHLKNNGIKCLNIPVKYRDQALISESEAKKYATLHVAERGIISDSFDRNGAQRNPMFWYFMVQLFDSVEISDGGELVTVDAVDGHIWGSEEFAEYSYDYNNCI